LLLFVSILFPILDSLSLPFCFANSNFVLPRDNDEPKKDYAAAPLLDALAISKELPQEETVVTKSLTVPSTKGTPTHASKRLKKAVAVGTPLEAHQPAVLSKNVCIAFFLLISHYLGFLSYFRFAEFDAKISLPWH
jgi:hypothetical protein